MTVIVNYIIIFLCLLCGFGSLLAILTKMMMNYDQKNSKVNRLYPPSQKRISNRFDFKDSKSLKSTEDEFTSSSSVYDSGQENARPSGHARNFLFEKRFKEDDEIELVSSRT